MDLISLGLFGLFTGCFISATLIPFPSEALLIGIYELGYPIWICLTIATVGNVLGSCTNYYIGSVSNNEKLRKKFKLNEERLSYWQQKFSRWGIWLGLLAWVPFVGDPMLVALGFFKVRFWPLLLTVTIGKFLRYLVLTMIYLEIFTQPF